MTPEVKSLYRLDTEMKFTTEVIHLTEENTDPRLSTMIMAKETTKVPSAAMNWLSVRLEMNRPMAMTMPPSMDAMIVAVFFMMIEF